MVAIVKIAGQQFKITAGQTLFIPKINAEVGAKYHFLTFYLWIIMVLYLLIMRLT